MRFLRAVARRLSAPPAASDVEPAVYRALVEFCEDWIRANGSPGDLETLDPLELDALLEAGRNVETQRATSRAIAARGPWGMAAVQAGHTVGPDGGQALDELTVEAVNGAFAARMAEALHARS